MILQRDGNFEIGRTIWNRTEFLSHRPGYLAHRRTLYKMKQIERSKTLEHIPSTEEDDLKNEFEKTNEGSDSGEHCGQPRGHGASLWDWVGAN